MTDDRPRGVVKYSIHSAAGEDDLLDEAIEKAQKAAAGVCEKEAREGYSFLDMKAQTLIGDRGKYVHVLTFVHGMTEVIEPGLELTATELQFEIDRLRALLGEAAYYVDHYGDSRKDRRLYLRLNAAANGEPEPGDDTGEELGD